MSAMVERLKDGFIRWRSGNAFLLTLLGVVAAYEVAHHFLGIDPDRSTANYWLSVEASTATCLLLDFAIKNMRADRATFDRIMAIEEKSLGIEERIEKALKKDAPL